MLRIAAALLLSAFCVLPAPAKEPAAKKPAPKKVEVKVLSVTGGVLKAAGSPLAAGAAVADGSELRLDAGQAVLDFGGEGKVLLTGPAVMKLAGRRLVLVGGGLLSVMSRLKGRYSVETPAAVAAVRGTEFFVEARADGSTYLCLCEGSIEVTGGKGLKYKKRFRSKHHQPAVFSRDGKTLKRVEAEMASHHDEDIEALK